MPTTTPRILVTHRVFPETKVILERAGSVIAPEQADAFSAAARLRHAQSATAMLAFMPDTVDDRFLSSAPDLRIVAAALKGYDNFDAPACARRGVWLTIVPDLLTDPAAELTIGLMIALARHVVAGDRHVRSGRYRGWRPSFYGRGLTGETAGFVGMGAIGRAIAKRLATFGMTLVYADPQRISQRDERHLRLVRVPLDRLLARADYVIIAAPLTGVTEHLFDRRRLARMKPGALLINPSRGSIVDEAAVASALAAGHLGGYAADAFEMEDWHRRDRPRVIPPTLRRHPNALFTPHLGSAVISARRAIERRAAENILDYFEGRPPRDAVAGPLGSTSPRALGGRRRAS
jgi:phosphonate dehydrogenase